MDKYLKKITEHSIHIMAILFIGLILGSIGIGILIQHNPLIGSFDAAVYKLIAQGPHHQFLDLLILPFNHSFLPWGEMHSYYYFMIGLPLIYLAIFKRHLFVWGVICFVLGQLIAGWITSIDWHYAFRQRPFLFLPNNVDQASKKIWEAWSSYPSGHTRETTLYAAIAVHFIPKLKWLAIIFCLFIGWSRIYIGAHYPTDVLAGWAVGYLSGYLAIMIIKELKIIWQNYRKVDHVPKKRLAKN